MNKNDFSRVISAFADTPEDFDWAGNKLIIQIREEIIEVDLSMQEGDLYVSEGIGTPIRAYQWILQRVARMEQLAQRILDYIPEEPNFVTPTGILLDDLDKDPIEEGSHQQNAISSTNNILSRQPVGVTSILYLTSDAGEGKTTTINKLSRQKALEFQRKESNWLLVPIALGGRSFMRLDDIIVADMSNRYRFMTYFQAFIELVRLNVIVPALDGFEEVFEERSSGEGASSLGRLIGELDGCGRLLVAARKAYFEIKSFAVQAKLYDSFGASGAVDFSRLSLERWSKSQFIDYASKRGLPNGVSLFHSVSERLGSNHPLLTRAVLAGRLVSVASEEEISDLLNSLGQHPEDYFYQFVNTIVEREAYTKWVFRSGDSEASEPLLTVKEHHELLTSIAREMWISGVDSLKEEMINLLAEVFSDEHLKNPEVGRQLQHKIHQHSLLVSSGQRKREVTFDHEDFRLFYLGQALARHMTRDLSGLETFIGAAMLPIRSIDAAIQNLRREGMDLSKISEQIKDIGAYHPSTSYTNANVAAIYLTMRNGLPNINTSTVRNLFFPADILRGKTLANISFNKCHFSPTSIGESKFNQINFSRCIFERIEIENSEVLNCKFDGCEIMSIVNLRNKNQDPLFSPQDILPALKNIGFQFDTDKVEENLEKPDENTRLACRALRTFMRSTHINEDVFKLRMGKDSNLFLNEVLPSLVDGEIIKEVEYTGAGVQQPRYKLNVAMKKIENAILRAKSVPNLIQELKQ